MTRLNSREVAKNYAVPSAKRPRNFFRLGAAKKKLKDLEALVKEINE